MNDSLRVRALFALPEQVSKSLFVLKLGEGVSKALETTRTYVVTPQLFNAFSDVFGQISSALSSGQSRAAYVHGSFGSGKSHFMAILSLLLSGHESAWAIPEFHPLRVKHSWVGQKSILQLRLHMLGMDNLEAAIFGQYLRWVQDEHPQAPIPSLFADQQLFEDAYRLCRNLGEEQFFSAINQRTNAGAWGALEQERRWSLARFEQAMNSADPELRQELFDMLVRSHFRSYLGQRHAYVDFDSGLATIARHAKSLGLDAVVLFLDEAILWLAGNAANSTWLNNEVLKLTKLVEAQGLSRDIPFVSFLARQRDIAELVGSQFAGIENERLRAAMDLIQGRIDTIQLEDRNLPAIIEKRLLCPKDAESKQALDAAFDRLRRSAGSALATLQAQEDVQVFRKLYPFSPALVEALVALSHSLQRNRTALKLLTDLLVAHIPDLTLGQVVPVGDLWDVLVGGDDSADGTMRARFDAAKQLYDYHVLPLLHETHGTGTPARCQRLRPEHRMSLGCAGCPQTMCRADNRLIKTLILAALVPETPSFKGLTISRLVQLNHGTLRSPIPGTEASLAAQRLRNYASQLGQIRIGEQQSDPTVAIEIGGVDLGPILQQAASSDTPGHRLNILTEMLAEQLGLESKDEGQPRERDYTLEWRGTRRSGKIIFGNVRAMPPEQLRCPDGHDWRLIVDYPFDEPERGPNDDQVVIDAILDQGPHSWSLVWLPSFFTEAINKVLGELAVLNHILESNNSIRQYLAGLRTEQQTITRQNLLSLQDQKRNRLKESLRQAYGLVGEKDDIIDSARSLSQHLYVLQPEVNIPVSLGGSFQTAMQEYLMALMERRYPRHPVFSVKLTSTTVERVLQLFADLLNVPEKRKEVERGDAEKLRGSLGELGMVRVVDTTVHLVEDRALQDLERKRQQKAEEHPTVGQLRYWMDENQLMGLQPEAQDLAVRAYALWSARVFVRAGKPYSLSSNRNKLFEDVVVERIELPEPRDWSTALDLTGHLFGISPRGRAINGDNLKYLDEQLSLWLDKHSEPCRSLPGLLEIRLGEAGLELDCARWQTAQSGALLCDLLDGLTPVEKVRRLGSFRPHTSAQALGKSIKQAKELVQLLSDRLIFSTLLQLRGRRKDLAGAEEILSTYEKLLRQDELNEPLCTKLRPLAVRAQELLAGDLPHPEVFVERRPEPEVPPTAVRLLERQVHKPLAEALPELRRLLQELEQLSGNQAENVLVHFTLTAESKR